MNLEMNSDCPLVPLGSALGSALAAQTEAGQLGSGWLEGEVW